MEIVNPPHDLGTTDPADLTSDELNALASEIMDVYQLGQLDDVLGE